MITQAIIPLAGLGTRLLPLTSVMPKELLPINGKPGIEYILEECVEAGIKEVIFIISEKKSGTGLAIKLCRQLNPLVTQGIRSKISPMPSVPPRTDGCFGSLIFLRKKILGYSGK